MPKIVFEMCYSIAVLLDDYFGFAIGIDLLGTLGTFRRGALRRRGGVTRGGSW